MANVGSDSSFCTRRKTSKKSASVGMISSELQNKPRNVNILQALALRGADSSRGDFSIAAPKPRCIRL